MAVVAFKRNEPDTSVMQMVTSAYECTIRMVQTMHIAPIVGDLLQNGQVSIVILPYVYWLTMPGQIY